MDNVKSEVEKYVQEILSKKPELAEYINSASILLTENDEGFVWDIMLLLSDELFKYEFAHLYSDCFVVDDHDHDPWVFTRVKSYKWLRQDFAQRLPIALWIFGNSIVIQDSEEKFAKILNEQKEIFSNSVYNILRRKYLEFRTERHNFRHSVAKVRLLANSIIKATIVKLALEMCFLSEAKPYPYKKWLPEVAKSDTTYGSLVTGIAEEFLESEDSEKTIELSENLVQFVISFLRKTEKFSDDFLNNWWLYLA